MGNISFSFVMPAYKAQFLHKAIESILNQTYRHFELIVVDDKSPDNLKEIVDVFTDDRIVFKSNSKNIGGEDLIKNWNHCIRFAKNDYIILATDDDMYEPDFLSDATKLIEKYPNVDLIRSGVKRIDENENVLDIEFPLKEYMTAREFVLFYAKGGTISCISNYIFKRIALEKAGGFIFLPRAHYSDDATALALSINGVACIATNDTSFRVSAINLSNRTDISIVKDQLNATEQYMTWYRKHIVFLNTQHNDFFQRACYGGYKARYIGMIANLTTKIPISRIFLTFHLILKNKHLFRKEKYNLLANYLISKL